MIFKYKRYNPILRVYETASSYLSFCPKLEYLSQIHTELTENKLIDCDPLELCTNNRDFNNSYTHQIYLIRNNKKHTCGKLYHLHNNEERSIKPKANSLEDFLNLRYQVQPAAPIEAPAALANPPIQGTQGAQGGQVVWSTRTTANDWYIPNTTAAVGAGNTTGMNHFYFTHNYRNNGNL